MLIVGASIGGFLSARMPPAQYDTSTYNGNASYTNTLIASNILSSDKHYDKAAALWISYATKASIHSNQSQGYLNAAAQYITDGQFSQAIDMCKKSEAAEGVTFDESEVAANAYMALGNNQMAIYYYQQAIRLNPKTGDDYAGDNSDFEAAIKQLQSQQ
jgi:tetratricopeptide (TPR) repeat protein